MNFFEAQRLARQRTKWLVILFIMAVAAIVFSTTTLITVAIDYKKLLPAPAFYFWRLFWDSFFKVGIFAGPAIVVVFVLVSLTRILSLSNGGGVSVADLLGATPLGFDSQDLKERQLRNIVEEMSIASGVPIPRIFVMREERGINACAAGTEPGNACVDSAFF